MANTILNVIKVTENIEEFKKALINNEGNVDFNLVAPMPTDLHIEKSSRSYQPNPTRQKEEEESVANGTRIGKFATRTLIQKHSQELLETSFTKELSQDEFAQKIVEKSVVNLKEKTNEFNPILDLIARGFYNLKKYGFVDWYDWSLNKWGTKWNADPDSVAISETENGLIIEFITAWTYPSSVYAELAKRFNFEVVYSDLDFKGTYVGTLTFKDQEVTINEFNKDDRLSEEDCIYLANKIEGGEVEVEIPEERQEALDELVKDLLP